LLPLRPPPRHTVFPYTTLFRSPNIFPISAELAKVIRMHQNGEKLTARQKMALGGSFLFVDEPKMHLSQYSPISRAAKKQIQTAINSAKDADDLYSEALYHTGVPSIEAAINEYLEKYALTSKISNAIESFQKIIEDQQMTQELMEELERNNEERQNLHEQMVRIDKI